MDFQDIHIGMMCGSKKGCGTVTWVDGSTQTVYLADIVNNNSFEVEFDDLLADPQVHNQEDAFY